MNIEVKDIITLNGKDKYIVSGKTIYQNETYYLLTGIPNFKDIKICVEVKDNEQIILEKVTEPELLDKVLPLFISSN